MAVSPMLIKVAAALLTSEKGRKGVGFLLVAKEGAEIIADNCQDTIFGGFAPNSQTAETLS